jgi:outer membrane lipase/esterase
MNARCRSLLSALAVATAFAAPEVSAQSFSGTVFFGDSLTDSGYFKPFLVPPVAPSGANQVIGRFTTNPGTVWSQNLANGWGTNAAPSNQGGTNYAAGGARVNAAPGYPSVLPTAAAPSVATQVSTYLASTGDSADRNALYAVWAGADDVFVQLDPTYAGPPGNVVTAAGDLVAQIARLKTAGARYVIVLNLPDIGRTPAFLGTPGAGPATQLSQLFNQTLLTGLQQSGLQVIPADVFGALNDILANPTGYGIANATGTACVGVPSSLLCSPLNLVQPSAAATYLFADGVHPSTQGHALLSQYIASIIQGPTQVSVLPETSVKNGVAMANILYGQLMTGAWLRAESGRNAWVNVNGNWQDFEGEQVFAGARGTAAALSVGADFKVTPGFVAGGYLGYGRIKPSFGASAGDYTQSDLSLGAYGGWRGGPWYANALMSYTWLDYDVSRQVNIGVSSRSLTGSPGGRNFAIGGQVGYTFDLGNLSHGPVAGLLWQQVKVDGYGESAGGATWLGLNYGSQTRDSLLGSLGWQVSYQAGGFVPYARLSYDYDFKDNKERDVSAQLQSLASLPAFSLPAFVPGQSWGTALVGVAGKFGSVTGNLGAMTTFGQSSASATTAFATVNVSF